MAYREVHGVEIQEIIRRWQAGLSQRRIASGTGLSRVTVAPLRRGGRGGRPHAGRSRAE